MIRIDNRKPSPTKVINQLGILGAVYEVNEGQRVLSPARKKLNLVDVVNARNLDDIDIRYSVE